MKKKYITIIAYTGIFGIAYGGFVYHLNSIERNNDASKISESVIPKKTVLEKTDFETSVQTVLQNNSVSNHPVSQPDFMSHNKQSVLTDNDDNYQNHAQESSSKNTKANSFSEYSVTNTNTSYFVEEQQDKPQVKSSYKETLSAATTNLAFNSSINTEQSGSTVSVNVVTPTIDSSNLETSDTNNTVTTFVEQTTIESDGSEFLPNGLSQQDLFSSQSKEPKVYTIKDYQTANINCANSEHNSSPHAALIRASKGC